MFPSTSVLSALALNSVITYFISAFWYSYSGFGKLWINSHFGNMSNYEANKNKKNTEKTMIATLLTTILYNCLLVFLNNNIYTPRDLKELIFMSIVLVSIHALLEISHVGYELRSYTTVAIHAAFHFAMTFIPLLVLRWYYHMPLSPIMKTF